MNLEKRAPQLCASAEVTDVIDVKALLLWKTVHPTLELMRTAFRGLKWNRSDEYGTHLP
jgi:hypothetical protein